MPDHDDQKHAELIAALKGVERAVDALPRRFFQVALRLARRTLRTVHVGVAAARTARVSGEDLEVDEGTAHITIGNLFSTDVGTIYANLDVSTTPDTITELYEVHSWSAYLGATQFKIGPLVADDPSLSVKKSVILEYTQNTGSGRWAEASTSDHRNKTLAEAATIIGAVPDDHDVTWFHIYTEATFENKVGYLRRCVHTTNGANAPIHEAYTLASSFGVLQAGNSLYFKTGANPSPDFPALGSSTTVWKYEWSTNVYTPPS